MPGFADSAMANSNTSFSLREDWAYWESKERKYKKHIYVNTVTLDGDTRSPHMNHRLEHGPGARAYRQNGGASWTPTRKHPAIHALGLFIGVNALRKEWIKLSSHTRFLSSRNGLRLVCTCTTFVLVWYSSLDGSAWRLWQVFPFGTLVASVKHSMAGTASMLSVVYASEK